MPCPEEDIRTAMEAICREHLGLVPGERLQVVADPPQHELAWKMVRAVAGLRLDCRLVPIGMVERAGAAPEGFRAELLARAEAALLVTSRSLSHTVARRRACRELGVRIASMPGLTAGMLARLFRPGIAPAVAARTEALAELLRGARRIEAFHPNGTELRLELGGRHVYTDNGLYTTTGRFGNLPAGEVSFAPLAGTLRGAAVVDVAFAGIGAVSALRLTLEHGGLVAVEGEAAPVVLELLAEGPDRVAGEFGIGTNHLARPGAITLEAEKAIGTIHLGFGDNLSFGGENRARGHWDAVLSCSRLVVDGRELDPSGELIP